MAGRIGPAFHPRPETAGMTDRRTDGRTDGGGVTDKPPCISVSAARAFTGATSSLHRRRRHRSSGAPLSCKCAQYL